MHIRRKRGNFSRIFRFLDISVRGILLDLDNTLYYYDICHTKGLRVAARYIQKKTGMSFIEFKRRYEVARKKTKGMLGEVAATHSRLLYFQHFLEDYYGKTKFRESLKMETLYWNDFFLHMKLRPNAEDFLHQCKKSGIRVCIVTDLTTRIQMEKIKYLGIAEYIDFIVSSEEVGEEKPNKKIYLIALKKLGLKNKDVLLVGDDDTRDVWGAKAVGIRAININAFL